MPRVAFGARWPHDLLVLHRLRGPLPVLYLCAASWGAVYSAHSPAELLALPVFGAIVVNMLCTVAGTALNTLTDLRTDQAHAHKHHHARAVRNIGSARLRRWITGELFLAALVLAAVASAPGRGWLLVPAAGTVLAHLAYNVEPVRLKRAGVLGAAVFPAGTVLGPYLLASGAVSGSVAAWEWPVVIGLWLTATGRTVWWSIPDVDADTSTGMGTPVVRHGIGRSLVYAVILLAVGAVALAWGLGWQYGPVRAAAGILAPLAVLALGAPLALRIRRGAEVGARQVGIPHTGLVVLGDVLLVLLPLLSWWLG